MAKRTLNWRSRAFLGTVFFSIILLSVTILFAVNASRIFADVNSTLTLSQNYPNPFADQTEIRFSIPEPGHVSLRIFNALGQEIQTAIDDDRAAGDYLLRFDGSRLPSGRYSYSLYFTTSNGETHSKLTKKMYLLR